MKTERIWVGLCVLLMIAIIVCSVSLTNVAYERNNLERQLIATLGAIDEFIVPGVIDVDSYGNISFEEKSLPEESFPWKKIFTISSDGKIYIDNIGGWGGRDNEKSWKDYPKFAEIGKK
jgi:hypothetical protein